MKYTTLSPHINTLDEEKKISILVGFPILAKGQSVIIKIGGDSVNVKQSICQ
jgi:hypothetical protein